jgi:hypothetical protein
MGAGGATGAAGATGATDWSDRHDWSHHHEDTWLSTWINQFNVLGSLDAKFLQGGSLAAKFLQGSATGPSGGGQPGHQDLTRTHTQLASDLTNVGGWANVLAPIGTNTGLGTGTTPDVPGRTVLPGWDDALHYHKPLLGPDQH